MRAKPTILITIDWFLPGFKAGGPVRSVANILEHLKHRFHFKIITRNTDYLETTPYNDLVANKWLAVDGYEVYYLSPDKLCRKEIKKLIQTTSYEKLYINGIYSFYFSILPVWFSRKLNKQVVVAPRGMLSNQGLDVKPWRKKLFLSLARATRFYAHVQWHATSEQEIADILSIGVKNIVYTAPNLPKPLATAPQPLVKQANFLKLVSVARVAPEKNQLFAINLLQKITNGAIQYDIYGGIYNQEYFKLCEQAANKLPERVKVVFKGDIHPNNINEVYAENHALLLPSLGENFGHAMLEAMSQARPVIISNNTPWRNLESHKAGWDIDLNNKAKFIESIKKLLAMDQQEYDQYAQSAFEYAKKFVENPKLIEQTEQILIS